MNSISLSQFRNNQSEQIATVQREPLELLSRGARRRAVVVSPEWFDRALEALEDKMAVEAAAQAREEKGTVPHEELMRQLDL